MVLVMKPWCGREENNYRRKPVTVQLGKSRKYEAKVASTF